MQQENFRIEFIYNINHERFSSFVNSGLNGGVKNPAVIPGCSFVSLSLVYQGVFTIQSRNRFFCPAEITDKYPW